MPIGKRKPKKKKGDDSNEPYDLIKDLEEIGAISVTSVIKTRVIPSSSLAFDESLIIGGFPIGNITSIWGPEGSGKTTIGITSLIKARKAGLEVAIIDTERKMNLEAYEKHGLGIPGTDYLLIRPKNHEAALTSVIKIAKAGYSLILLDSMYGAPSNAEYEGDVGNSNMGIRARLNGTWFRQAVGDLSVTDAAVILINQVRDNMDGFKPQKPGGRAIPFHSAINVDLFTPEYLYRNAEHKKTGFDPIGMKVKGRIDKNSLDNSKREVSIDIRFTPFTQVNVVQELLDMGRKYGILLKKDGTIIQSVTAEHFFRDTSLGSGSVEPAKSLAKDASLRFALENDIRARMSQGIIVKQVQNGSGNESGDKENAANDN